jgi:hypothetical protein
MHISAAYWKEDCCMIAGMFADSSNKTDNKIDDDIDNAYNEQHSYMQNGKLA